MGKLSGVVATMLCALLALPLHAADTQQDRLTQRVIALTDGCQRHALVAQVQAGVAARGQQLALDTPPGGDVLAIFAWQQQLLYVIAGLAEQWSVAQWSREGVSLAGRLRNGDMPWVQAQPALRHWQLRAASLPPAAQGCPTRVPRRVRRLGNDLVAWIVPAARQHAISSGME